MTLFPEVRENLLRKALTWRESTTYNTVESNGKRNLRAPFRTSLPFEPCVLREDYRIGSYRYPDRRVDNATGAAYQSLFVK